MTELGVLRRVWCVPMASERYYRKEIVRLGRLLHQSGLVAATDGNLSVRLDDERILVTPTGMSKGAMRPSDMVVVDPEGRPSPSTRIACFR